MRKVIDAVLLLLVLCGGFLAWQTGRERLRLSKRYDQLVRIAGDLAINDYTKVNVQAIATGEPLHFAWRMYTPPYYRMVLSSGSGMSTSWSSDQREFIGRVRFRETREGLLEVYTHFSGGSSSLTVGGPALAKFLHGRWDQVQVEQLGSGGLTVVDPGKSAVLLRMKLSDELAEEARKTLPPHEQQRLFPTIHELRLGSNTPKL